MSDLSTFLAAGRVLTHLYRMDEPAGASAAADAFGGPSGAASGVTFGASGVPGSGQTAADFSGGGDVSVGALLIDEARARTVRASLYWGGAVRGGWFAAGSVFGGYSLSVTAGGLLEFPGPSGGAAGRTYTTPVALTALAWHDVAWDYDPATDAHSWFLDGALAYSTTGVFDGPDTALTHLGHGFIGGGFPGRVQDVAIYAAPPPPRPPRRRICDF